MTPLSHFVKKTPMHFWKHLLEELRDLVRHPDGFTSLFLMVWLIFGALIFWFRRIDRARIMRSRIAAAEAAMRATVASPPPAGAADPSPANLSPQNAPPLALPGEIFKYHRGLSGYLAWTMWAIAGPFFLWVCIHVRSLNEYRHQQFLEHRAETQKLQDIKIIHQLRADKLAAELGYPLISSEQSMAFWKETRDLPKGLVKFHTWSDPRDPANEQWCEALKAILLDAGYPEDWPGQSVIYCFWTPESSAVDLNKVDRATFQIPPHVEPLFAALEKSGIIASATEAKSHVTIGGDTLYLLRLKPAPPPPSPPAETSALPPKKAP